MKYQHALYIYYNIFKRTYYLIKHGKYKHINCN